MPIGLCMVPNGCAFADMHVTALDAFAKIAMARNVDTREEIAGIHFAAGVHPHPRLPDLVDTALSDCRSDRRRQLPSPTDCYASGSCPPMVICAVGAH